VGARAPAPPSCASAASLKACRQGYEDTFASAFAVGSLQYSTRYYWYSPGSYWTLSLVFSPRQGKHASHCRRCLAGWCPLFISFFFSSFLRGRSTVFWVLVLVSSYLITRSNFYIASIFPAALFCGAQPQRKHPSTPPSAHRHQVSLA